MWKKYPFAIFDMDGTLIDSMPYWRNLGRDYLISQGKTPEPDLLDIIGPMSLEESAAYFRDYYGVEGDVPSIKDGINALMRENYLRYVPAKEGAAEYLEKLEGLGVQMCLCTATSSDLAEMILERLGLRRYFRWLVSCDEVGVGKNRPDVFHLALKRMGIEASEAIMFEDALFAIKTAKSVGLCTVGVYDDCRSHKRQEIEAACDYYFESFATAPF